MTDAPKKIWVWEKEAPAFVSDNPDHDDIPYIRADIVAELVEASEGLLTDITEYQEINNLGGQNNHWQVKVRAALAKLEER